MKVYNPDWTLLKTSPIQKGLVSGESDVIQFAIYFTDNAIQYVDTERLVWAREDTIQYWI